MLHVIKHPVHGKLVLAPAPKGELKIGVVSVIKMIDGKVGYASLDLSEIGFEIPAEILALYGYGKPSVSAEGTLKQIEEESLKQLIASGAKVIVVGNSKTGMPGIFENMTGLQSTENAVIEEIVRLNNFFK